MRRAILGVSLLAFTFYVAVGQSAAPRQVGTSVRDVRPDVRLPAESAGWDAVLEGVLSAFDKADVVALGEAHSRKVDSDLRNRLIRHPDFPNKAHVIVVEFGNSFYQPILDRYIDGQDVPLAEVQKVWQNSTQLGLASPVYEQFLAAVREVNRQLPTTKRLRVLAGDPPRDWSKEQTPADRARYNTLRSASPVSILRDQVLKKGDKALVIYGSGHLWHGDGGITKALQEDIPGRVFVAETLAPVSNGGTGPEFDNLDKALQSLEGTLPSRERPVLVSLRGTLAARLPANPFFLGQAMLSPDVTLGDIDDACVYFGRTTDVGALVR